MSKTLSIRLPDDLQTWLESKSEETGLPKGQIVRDQLERARAAESLPAFLKIAGRVEGTRDLSSKRGFNP